jgi:hypothetical protein
MSEAALDAFAGAQAALDLALDGTDPRAIDTACDQFRRAIFDVRAVGAWRTHPELARERLAALESVRSASGLYLYNQRGAAAR